jgi:hypothetical protein
MPGKVLIGAEAALDHCFDDNGREPAPPHAPCSDRPCRRIRRWWGDK